MPVIHKLLVKSIEEDKDGEYELIGTIIHNQVETPQRLQTPPALIPVGR